MKKAFIFALFCIFVAIFPVASKDEASPRYAKQFWKGFRENINLDRLFSEKESLLGEFNATLDPDNLNYFLEYPLSLPQHQRFLASLTFTSENLVKIQLFPPQSMQAPFFSGFVKLGKNKINFRGTVSDYSDQISGSSDDRL
jgi:hypothetical protein